MPAVSLAPLEIEAAPSLAERAYARLRDAIVEGSLAAGTKLSERRLAAALGISAQPVREALRRLEGEGLVETRPKSGTFVSSLDSDRLAEMGRIRAALEGAAAALATRRAGPAELRVLEQRLGAIRAATTQGDRVTLAEANDAFHTALHRITGNAFLIRSLQALRAYFHVGSRRVLGGEEQFQRAEAEHIAIVEAIATGEADRAEALMHAHALRSLRVAFPEETA